MKLANTTSNMKRSRKHYIRCALMRRLRKFAYENKVLRERYESLLKLRDESKGKDVYIVTGYTPYSTGDKHISAVFTSYSKADEYVKNDTGYLAMADIEGPYVIEG